MRSDCKFCGNLLTEFESRHQDATCDSCEVEREKEEAQAIEAEYEDRRWDLAAEYGYDHP